MARRLAFGLTATMQSGAAVSVTGLALLDGVAYQVRPDRVEGAALWLPDLSVPSGRRINPSAFAMPSGSTQGNLGRNALRGTPLRQLDLMASRTLREGAVSLQVRLEVTSVRPL